MADNSQAGFQRVELRWVWGVGQVVEPGRVLREQRYDGAADRRVATVMTTALLMRVACVSALLALLALLLAGIFLVLFFRRGEPYGSLNDFFSALALLLLILPAAAVYVVARATSACGCSSSPSQRSPAWRSPPPGSSC